MKTGLILESPYWLPHAAARRAGRPLPGRDTTAVAADSGMQVRYYEGTLPTGDGTPINYELELKNEEFSGDGTYDLTMIYPKADKGKDKSSGWWDAGERCAVRPKIPMRPCIRLNIGDTTLEQINFLYYPDRLGTAESASGAVGARPELCVEAG